MKKVTTGLVIILLISILSVGCTSSTHSATSRKYIASFYPLEYLMQELLGSSKDTANITPVGAEPHELELSPDLAIDIQDADFVIAMGKGFAPSVEKVAKRNKHHLMILNELTETKNIDDPHFWLDPVLMKKAAKILSTKLIDIIPNQKDFIEKNLVKLNTKFDQLDNLYSSTLLNCETKTFITSHDAFDYLATRYGLTLESIAGYSPESEPSPSRFDELVELAKSKNVKVIFSEKLSSDKLSKTLANEIGGKVESINSIEFLTNQDIKDKKNYISIMRENLTILSSALGCN